jgi:hypothetical protein
MSEITKKSPRDTKWWILIILFFIVAIIWGLSWCLIVNSEQLSKWSERGTFGDMFGAVNALFSGLAFAGVIYAIYLQTKELKLQRIELEQTRKELERSASAQEATENALVKQVQLQALAAAISIANIEFQRTQQGTIGEQMAKENINRLQKQLNILLKEANILEK